MIRTGTRPGRRGAGFTLVELLVVITIIAILIALLVPAVIGAVNSAREAQVASEVNAMGQALASFKNQYGSYPPSRIMLSETGYYPTGSTSEIGALPISLDGTGNAAWLSVKGIGPIPAGTKAATGELSLGELAKRSYNVMRKFFPRAAYFTGNDDDPTASGAAAGHDFNGDGVMQRSYIYLSGDECLAFFLGGIPLFAADSSGEVRPQQLTGFSKMPSNPFQAPGTSSNRTEPFFEFRNERLVDWDGDGMASYYDTLARGADGRPYAYFSAGSGGNYDPNDVNFVNGAAASVISPDDSTVAVPYEVNYRTTPIVSFFPNPYTISQPVNPLGPSSYKQPESFQIISPGRDLLYGPGGQYQADSNADKFPAYDVNLGPPLTVLPNDTVARERQVQEADNITNFQARRLD